MKRLAFIVVVLLSPLVLADVDLYNSGAHIGRVRDLNCIIDGGLSCVRDAGTVMAQVSCNPASATETGCVTPGAQSYAGTKTLTGDLRLVGHVHASLTACVSGTKGMWQTCTTHNSPVFCDGTANFELLGAQAPEYELWSIATKGIPVSLFGAVTLSSASSWTITAVNAFWGTGSGSGSLDLTFGSSAGTCTCSIDCDNPAARTACTGNCTISAGDTVFGIRGASTCTLDPYVGYSLNVMGTMP